MTTDSFGLLVHCCKTMVVLMIDLYLFSALTFGAVSIFNKPLLTFAEIHFTQQSVSHVMLNRDLHRTLFAWLAIFSM